MDGPQMLAVVLVVSIAILMIRAVVRGAAPEVAGGQHRSRPSDAPLYSIRSLRKIYRASAETICALRDVDVDLGYGVTGIVGPSGQGKSTFLNCIGGLDVPTRGQILFKGRPVPFGDEVAMRRFRAHNVVWVFQDLNLVTHQTVVENTALPLLCRGVPRRRALAAATENLTRVGLAGFGGRRPHQLSGGQKQRAAIARAFTAGAEVILADEPTGSLDPESAEEMMKAFRELSVSTGTPLVLVTHNHELAHKYCDRVLECSTDGLKDVTRPRVMGSCPPCGAADDMGGAVDEIAGAVDEMGGGAERERPGRPGRPDPNPQTAPFWRT